MKLWNKINSINDKIALRITIIFGTMWVTYAFMFYGFCPVIFPAAMSTMLYWSNTVQLWSLPLLMVGQNLMNKSSERRAQRTYEMVKEELVIIKRLCSNCQYNEGTE